MLAVNWSLPNFVNICIDERKDGELTGRLYHKYTREAVPFLHLMGLLKAMDDLYETINYPQTTVHRRSFLKEESVTCNRPELTEVWESQEFGEMRGACATFYILVKGRANASWQGEVIWVEQGITKTFRSAMELLILMDNAVK